MSRKTDLSNCKCLAGRQLVVKAFSGRFGNWWQVANEFLDATVLKHPPSGNK